MNDMSHKLFQVGVKALVSDDSGKLLLLKATNVGKYKAHWDLPGGRIEDNQSAEEALRREIHEEIGVTSLSDIKLFLGCISNFELDVSEIGSVGLVLMAYKVLIPVNSTIELSDEHNEYEWVDSTTAAERLSYKYPPEFTQAIALL